jgi:hypothetical protein
MLRLYNEGQPPLEESLETAARRGGGWCEMAASLGVSGVRGLLWFGLCELLLFEAGG